MPVRAGTIRFRLLGSAAGKTVPRPFALLIECEDKFPYAKYPFLRDPDAFTARELEEAGT